VKVNGQLHASAALASVERISGSRLMGGWVGLRAGLDIPLPGIKPRFLGRPVPSPVTILLLLLLLLSRNDQNVEEEKGTRM
jgi:hypothetical protein